MSALTASVLGLALFTPALAPVPAEPKPDPFAPGYLGIYFSGVGPNSTLMIDHLDPRQPAERAGLLPGDVIVRVNDLRPRVVQEVINHVCTFRPGAVVEVEVQRGAERKSFKIKLGVRVEPLSYAPPPLDR